MKRPGAAIFLIFFGVSLLDAIRGGPWYRALFWIAIGFAFLAMDRRRIRRARPQPGRPI
jgi:hypothetical protein